MLLHSMSAMLVVALPDLAVVEAAAAITGTAVGNNVEAAHLLVGPRTVMGAPKDVIPCLWHTPSTPPPVCWGNSRAVPHLEFHSTLLQVQMPQAVSPVVLQGDTWRVSSCSHYTGPGTTAALLQHDKEVYQLECMLLLWI
jgi:hypothetical protein